MLFRNRKAETATQKPAAVASEIELAKDTIAALLRTLAEFCLPTKSHPTPDYERRCEELAAEVLVKRKVDAEAEAPRELLNVHRDLRATVREQRRAESREYRTHRETSRVVVEDLVRQMRQALHAQETGFSEVLGHLDALEAAVESGEPELIRDTTHKAVQGVRGVIEIQTQREKERLRRLEDRVEEMSGELEEARAEAQIDALTGLLNRGAGEEALQRAIVETRIARRDVAVFMVDIDHFKKVNDTYGHSTGDEVIKGVARVLSMSFPRRDDVVSRWGGEEFLILCRDVEGKDVRNLAERARESIERLRIPATSDIVTATVSIGFSSLRYEDGQPELPSALVGRADSFLYEAKEQGRNRVCGPSD